MTQSSGTARRGSTSPRRIRRWSERYVRAAGWQRALIGAALVSALLVLIVLGVQPFIGAAGVINLLIGVTIVVALGSFMGNSGVLSLAHVGFVAIGAYVSGLLTIPSEVKATALPRLAPELQQLELTLLGALPIALVVVIVVALLLSPAVVRPGGYAAAIASLGVLVIIRSLLVWMEPMTRGSQTFYGIPRLTTVPLALGVAVVTIIVARAFRESRTGLLLRASRDDELAARSFGANVTMLRLKSWLISAALAGLGGVMMGHFITAFSPAQFFLALALSYLVMLIVGGAGTVAGATLGAVGIVLTIEFLSGLESGFTVGPVRVGAFHGLPQFVLAFVMLIVLYLRPTGVIGFREPDEMLAATLAGRAAAQDSNQSVTRKDAA